MGYRKMQVYDKSNKAAIAIYRQTKTFPREEMYGIPSQLRRAATSIPLCIAEGYAKKESQEEFRRFLKMALGSSDEVLVLLEFSKDLEYMEETTYQKAKKEYEAISKMLNTLTKKIKSEN